MHDYARLEHASAHHNDWFVVNWCLGNTCNFSCSYCLPGLHDGSKKWPSKEDVQSFIERLMKAHPSKKFYFEFTGGEVTLYRDFIDICRFIKDKGGDVGCISNASRTLRWWDENKAVMDHVCLSFHPEEADPVHYLQVVQLLHKVTSVHSNIMMHPDADKFNTGLALAVQVAALGDVSLALQPLLVDFGTRLYEYTPEQTARLDSQTELTKTIKYTRALKHYRGAMRKVETGEVKSPHRFIADGSNNWRGWDCYAGVEQLIVDMDGSVHRGWCKVGASIGKIWDANLPLYTEPVRCTKTMCHCNFDIMATKVKPVVIPIIILHQDDDEEGWLRALQG
jgi:molybdenum cofactor biosynthesis enzyme MoaA